MSLLFVTKARIPEHKGKPVHLTEIMTSFSLYVKTGNGKEALSWKWCNSSSTATDGCNSESVHRWTLVPLYVSQEGKTELLKDHKA